MHVRVLSGAILTFHERFAAAQLQTAAIVSFLSVRWSCPGISSRAPFAAYHCSAPAAAEK